MVLPQGHFCSLWKGLCLLLLLSSLAHFEPCRESMTKSKTLAPGTKAQMHSADPCRRQSPHFASVHGMSLVCHDQLGMMIAFTNHYRFYLDSHREQWCQGRGGISGEECRITGMFCLGRWLVRWSHKQLLAICGWEPGCHSLELSGENFVALHLIFCVVLDSVTFNFGVVSLDQPVYYFWFSVNKIHI